MGIVRVFRRGAARLDASRSSPLATVLRLILLPGKELADGTGAIARGE
jgi:hypothetical protein